MKGKLLALLGAWGRPPDLPAQIALGLALALAIVAIFGRGRSLLGLGREPLPRRLFLWLAAFAAALLSILYIGFYLRGGPRIVDATTYFLQGRALSEGSLTWPVLEPSASFRGRFLLYRDGAMGGIFPPGYPLLLAFGFALGAPMVVGPAIAAALVVATYRLARTLAERAAPEEMVEPIARTAALFSVASAALRYHTADTMSHGATALGIVLALDLALRGKAAAAGLAVGLVAATRPASALAIGVIVGVALLGQRDRRLLVRAAIGTLPALALLLTAQQAVTGAWFTSSQRMYYAISDGPPGCFRWGFGAAGCVYEHEDFVRARLPNGYGLVEAAGTTLRRLRMHLEDVANLEPLALLALVPALRAPRPRARAATLALALVGLHVLAYAPFYFDGNYPGGGARFFVEVVPVEHALLALGIARLASQHDARFARGAMSALALALGGFAVHAAYDHEKLADRDGGRPMYEPDVIAKAHVTTGLLFVDTDHGFALAHDPGADAKTGLVVARRRDDDHDWLLFERLGRPPSWSYHFDRSVDPAVPVVVAWSPPAPKGPIRFEADADWPALAQAGAFAVPGWTEACASQKRALLVTPGTPHGEGTVTLSLPVPSPGRYVVTVAVVHGAHLPSREAPAAGAIGTLTIGAQKWEWPAPGAGCATLPNCEIELNGTSVPVVVGVRGGSIALDTIVLRRLP
jgi:hypothetical protein